MPNFTPILSPEHLTPFSGCFVSIIKSNGEDATAYFSGETRELWLIRYRSNWPSLHAFNATASTAWLAHILELRERDTKFLIKLDDAYFKSLSSEAPIQLAHMSEPEIQNHKTLFQDKKISLFPNSACPDTLTAMSILDVQQARLGNQPVDSAATKILFHDMVKEICSQLKSQSWKPLPVQVSLEPWEGEDDVIIELAKPSELYILSAQISLPFNQTDRADIRERFSTVFRNETNNRRKAKQRMYFSIDANEQQARLLIQAFSLEAMNSNPPLALISELEASFLQASDPLLSFDRFTPPRLSPGPFGLFADGGGVGDPMKPIHFSDDLIPYAGQIVFYETVACQSKSASDWFDCIKLGEQYVFPGYISRYLSDQGCNYCYNLSQIDSIYPSLHTNQISTQGRIYQLHAFTLKSLKLHLRLPNNDELIELKKAYEEGRLKLTINRQHPCTFEEFSELVDSQFVRSAQQPPAQNLRLGV